MSCKSAIFTANTTSQTVPVGGTLALGSVIRRCGCDLNLSGNSDSALTLVLSGAAATVSNVAVVVERI